MSRKILHVNLDAFFCGMEELHLPALCLQIYINSATATCRLAAKLWRCSLIRSISCNVSAVK